LVLDSLYYLRALVDLSGDPVKPLADIPFTLPFLIVK
jgi:hypothetical protein